METPCRAGLPLRVRASSALGLICASFLLLSGRLVQLQIVEADYFSELANEQQLVSRRLSARRGTIFDRTGRTLAASVRVWSVFADPEMLEDHAAAADALGRTLELDPNALMRKFQRGNRFAWVKRRVREKEARAVRALKIRGVHLRSEFKRYHPQGTSAAHVTGFTDIDGVGLAGTELQLDAILRGCPGLETVRWDGGRRIIRTVGPRVRRDPFDGYNVSLTLDLQVQIIVEEELDRAVEEHKPEGAIGIVMDPCTGDILAMASRPGFDPRSPGDWPPANWRNMSVTDAYEFGSVMKPIGVSVALDNGVVTPETEFDCHNGAWRATRGRTVHDSHPYGLLSVFDIVVHSSNIGAAQVGLRLGIERFYAGLEGFGYGSPSGIALPGEISGILRPVRYWTKHSVISASFGQEIAVTPIAMVRAFSVFANDGRLPQPRIVQRIEHAETGVVVYEAGEPAPGPQVISPAIADTVLDILQGVIDRGTGENARVDGYAVAGKTGTAQMLRTDGRGYDPGRWLGSFIGIAPVPDARIVVLVAIKVPTKGGYYGGTVAAPAVHNIMERSLQYLRVPPNRVAVEGDMP